MQISRMWLVIRLPQLPSWFLWTVPELLWRDFTFVRLRMTMMTGAQSWSMDYLLWMMVTRLFTIMSRTRRMQMEIRWQAMTSGSRMRMRIIQIAISVSFRWRQFQRSLFIWMELLRMEFLMLLIWQERVRQKLLPWVKWWRVLVLMTAKTVLRMILRKRIQHQRLHLRRSSQILLLHLHLHRSLQVLRIIVAAVILHRMIPVQIRRNSISDSRFPV